MVEGKCYIFKYSNHYAQSTIGEDGRYYFQAGTICNAGKGISTLQLNMLTQFKTYLLKGTWRLEDKIGMPLEDIHISGGVPRCAYLPTIMLPLPHD